MKLFVSYSRENLEVAEDIVTRLRAAGHTVFFDRHTLPSGQAFDTLIRKEIVSSHVFLFLISPSSVRKGSYARTELRFAEIEWPNPGSRVLPVLIEPTPFKEIPAYLRAVTFFEAEGNLTAELCVEVERRKPKGKAWLYAVAAAALLAILGIIYGEDLLRRPSGGGGSQSNTAASATPAPAPVVSPTPTPTPSPEATPTPSPTPEKVVAAAAPAPVPPAALPAVEPAVPLAVTLPAVPPAAPPPVSDEPKGEGKVTALKEKRGIGDPGLGFAQGMGTFGGKNDPGIMAPVGPSIGASSLQQPSASTYASSSRPNLPRSSNDVESRKPPKKGDGKALNEMSDAEFDKLLEDFEKRSKEKGLWFLITPAKEYKRKVWGVTRYTPQESIKVKDKEGNEFYADRYGTSEEAAAAKRVSSLTSIIGPIHSLNGYTEVKEE